MLWMLIRPETPADATAVFRVVADAFGREHEARLVNALRKSPAFVPELSLVACLAGGSIVGHILFTRMAIKASDRSHSALALAPLAVMPVHQKSGIGSALVRHGLAESTRLGHRVVIVLGHPDYYPRFGFLPASRFGVRAPFEARPEAFMALELEAGALQHVHGEAEYAPEFMSV